MQNDPLGFAAGDDNTYRDEGNNPANRVDPSGLAPPPDPGLRQFGLSWFGNGRTGYRFHGGAAGLENLARALKDPAQFTGPSGCGRLGEFATALRTTINSRGRNLSPDDGHQNELWMEVMVYRIIEQEMDIRGCKPPPGAPYGCPQPANVTVPAWLQPRPNPPTPPLPVVISTPRIDVPPELVAGGILAVIGGGLLIAAGVAAEAIPGAQPVGIGAIVIGIGLIVGSPGSANASGGDDDRNPYGGDGGGGSWGSSGGAGGDPDWGTRGR